MLKRLHNTNRFGNAARILLACVLMTQLAGGAFAASVSLAWDPNSESNVAGYNVYRSPQAGSFTTPVNGSTPLQAPSLTDSSAQSGATYYYVVKAVNTDGLESSASNELQVTVAPAALACTVSITPPAGGSSSEINASGAGVVGVQFKVNGANVGAEDTTSPFSVSWNTSKLASGTYTWTAVARDAAGNQTTCAAGPVKVDKGVANKIQILDRSGNSWDNASSSQALSVGFARLQQDGGAAPSSGVAVIGLKNGANVVSEASVPGSIPVREGRLYVDYSGPANTGVAIANDNSEDAVISYYFTDSTGVDFGQGSFPLEAKHQTSGFVTEAPFNLGRQMKGSLTLSSTVPVAIMALRGYTNERSEFLMTTLPVGSVGVASAAHTVVFPHFADGNGWTTQVVLTNPMDVELTGTVQFFRAESATAAGSAMAMTANGTTASSFDYKIAPRSAYRLVTANASSDLRSGSVLVTPATNSVVPQGLSIFSYSSQGVTVSEAGVPAEPAGTDFRTYVESMGTVRSGLAIANSSATPARVTFELTTLDDVPTGMTATQDIAANGHAAQFITELFPALQDGFQGVLRIASSQPVTVVGLRLRVNEHGDLLIASMPVVDEAVPAATSDLVFPIVVFGGGYTTEFVTINR